MAKYTNNKAIAVGFSCVDVYEKLNKWYPTGNGIDWGIHLSRMGIPISILTVVGTDQYGKSMKEVLQKEKIDVSHLHIEEGETCKMLMDLHENDRIHLKEIEGVMESFEISKEDKEFIKTFQYMHTDLFGKALNDLEEFQEAGVKVIMDFSVFSNDPEYQGKKYFPYVDYVFLSYEKDDEFIEKRIKEIHSYGPKIVTATLGEKGSISYDGTCIYRQGIVPVEVVNTVGAGDSYIAGFSYGIMLGYDIPSCMELGARTSAKVVSKFEPY